MKKTGYSHRCGCGHTTKHRRKSTKPICSNCHKLGKPRRK